MIPLRCKSRSSVVSFRVRDLAVVVLPGLLLCFPAALFGALSEEVITRSQSGGMLMTMEGGVKFQRAPHPEHDAIQRQKLVFEDSLRTLAASRASVILNDASEVRMKPLTHLILLPQGLGLRNGGIYVSSRGQPRSMSVETTPGTLAKPNGTEYLITVEGDTTEVTLFDGEAELSNGVDKKTIHTGYQGTARPGQDIQIRPILKAKNIMQWWIYYPAVLDPAEIEPGLAPAEKAQLAASLASYRAGDLQAALTNCPGYPNPTPVEPISEAQRTYLAALYLAVGAVEHTEGQLTSVSTNAPRAVALRTMIAAVAPPLGGQRAESRGQRAESENQMSTSELLALSYAHQSTNGLKEALRAARLAVEQSRDFGFGLARVAELEFSFAHTHAAREAVMRALHVTPRNAQAHALNGFLLAAENHTKEAIAEFDEAIALDPALGNAWLGRGLCRVRSAGFKVQNLNPLGSAYRIPHSALEDLETAAILEPTRSLTRSYAGKAFAEIGAMRLAEKELNFARELDPNDPTPWLYLALVDRDQNRINSSVRELETSIDLNDNRALYRSRFLLDEDRAVRSASLASIYREAGMTDVSLREAAKAASDDYGNYSAHLFLANSYDSLRDPTRFNLRYETVWFNELLLANLLAPVGAGTFSQSISQQEYSRLFDVQRFGLTTTTDARSDGQFREVTSQFGSYGNFGYSLDLDYGHNEDTGARSRPNNGLDRIEWYSQLKYQLTAADTVFVLTKYQDYHSGDNFQYYDWRGSVRTNFTFDEFQRPIVVGGYHHEWSSGVHTLALAGRLENDQRFSDRGAPELIITKSPSLLSPLVSTAPFDVRHRSEFEAYTAELSQIFEGAWQTLIIGARYQTGDFTTRDELAAPVLGNAVFPPTSTNVTADFERTTAYGYYTVEPWPDLFLIGGVSYDTVKYPENFRNPPIEPGTETRNRLSPKAALIYSPAKPVTVRGIYARSLGGVTLDESYRLEPTQLAGFVQTFRSVIPESVVGSVSAPAFEIYGAALDVKFNTGTYVGIGAQMLSSELTQEIGVFDFNIQSGLPLVPSSTRERLDFREGSIGLAVNQLLGNEWSFGISYNFTSSELNAHLLDVPNVVGNFTNSDNSATSDLHHFGANVLLRHPAGFFARAEANWYEQDNTLDTSDSNAARVKINQPSDEFPQFNLFFGWRFPRQRGDLTLAVLNVGGKDYHLNPLNSYAELPHERVYAAQLRLRF